MKDFFRLIKIRIIFVNLFAVLGGFFFALSSVINFELLFFVLLGTTFIISSACIFNNIIDIDIDKKMFRTRKRILIKSKKLIIYSGIMGIFLFILSILIFLMKVNILSCIFSILGFFFYVIIYSLCMKRISIYDVILGSISGAMPPLIGYCAVTDFIDLKSILLFLICMIWQIPHSYAILILYKKDYKIAKIPTIVNQKGEENTLKNIMFYILLFIIFIILFYFFHYIHVFFFIVLLFISVLWFLLSYMYYTLNILNSSKLLLRISIIIIIIFHLSLITNYTFL